MNRANQILVIILVVQLAVAAVVLWPRQATSSGEGESLFPGVEAEKITSLSITDADGNNIVLARRGDGWVLPAADDYPVLEENVSTLLTAIAELRIDQPVTETSGSHPRLKVAEDDFERLISFELDDGSTHRLFLGTSPSYQATHVRAGNDDQVYLISGISPQDAGTQATAWAERTYFSVPRDEVVAFTLENAQGSFEFVKVGDAWMLADQGTDETINENGVEAVLNRVTSVALLRPLGKVEEDAYGLVEPSALVTLTTRSQEEGNQTYSLRVGAQDPEDDSYVVISSESPYYVRVSQFTVQDLVEKGRDGFIQPPPTPTP